MKTQKPAKAASPDSVFPYINGINMEVAIELLGQEIAKRSAAIADEEAKVELDHKTLSMLNEERDMLCQRRQALRADQPEGIEAVFAEFGRSRSHGGSIRD